MNLHAARIGLTGLGLAITLTAAAGVHHGSPDLGAHVVPGEGWSLTVANDQDATLHLRDCASGAWTEADRAKLDTEWLGWKLPAGTWCEADWAWQSHVDIDATGPQSRTVDATVEMGELQVVFDVVLVVDAGSTREFILHLGDGDIWTAAEAFLNPGATWTIVPGTSQHDTLRDALHEATLAEDLNGDGKLDSYELANAVIGTAI